MVSLNIVLPINCKIITGNLENHAQARAGLDTVKRVMFTANIAALGPKIF